MAEKEKEAEPKTVQISVTLPSRAIELLEQVAQTGLCGSTRGEAARHLISRGLEELIGKGIITLPRGGG